MSKEVAKTSARINPHGLGIIWLDTFEVTYHKSTEYNQLITERPFIAHFRYATVGKIGISNTHPFVCGKNKEELLMMNGTIKGMGNAEMCDSKELAIKMGSINRAEWKGQLEKFDSRFVTVNLRTRSFQIYNRNLYTYRDGIWYSKANVLQDNVVAVYGTLKKGFGNYYAYLKNSKHLGRGETKDRYPLVVNGLPYLVNKKGIGHNVVVDVFKVSDTTFDNLDALEGHPRWYRREQVPITLNGKTLNCWVYFNPQSLNGAELHKSFERNAQPRFSFDKGEIDYDSKSLPLPNVDLYTEKHDTIEIGWDSEEFNPSENVRCLDCLNTVEHDGWNNYYCSACEGWFSETEIMMSENVSSKIH